MHACQSALTFAIRWWVKAKVHTDRARQPLYPLQQPNLSQAALSLVSRRAYGATRLDSWKLCAHAGCLNETTLLAARGVVWLAVTLPLRAVIISALAIVVYGSQEGKLLLFEAV